MGKRTTNSVINNLGWNSRVQRESPNAGRMQNQLGVQFKNPASVTLAEVQQSNADLEEAKQQRKRTARFVSNTEQIISIKAEIEKLILKLLQHGYRTDVEIERLVQTGKKNSAEYQAAIQLLQAKGRLKEAEIAQKHTQDVTRAGHSFQQAVAYNTHKHGLSMQTITASFNQKKQLATQNQQITLASKEQKQLAQAAESQALKALPGGQTQPVLAGYSGGMSNGRGGGGGNGGFFAGLKNLFRF